MTRPALPAPDEYTRALLLSAIAVVVGIAIAVLSCREWKW